MAVLPHVSDQRVCSRPGRLLAPARYEIAHAPVVRALLFFREIAGRELIRAPVVSQAFAAVSVARATAVGAVAGGDVLRLVLAVHGGIVAADSRSRKRKTRWKKFEKTDANVL